MSDSSPTDWLGQSTLSRQHIAPLLVERIAATFGQPCPAPGQALPPLWHWAFFQPAEAPEALGDDGHPARGGFLPPAAGRNRMWAGSRLAFDHPLIIDAPAEREAEITHIEEKQGRSGALLFVTVRHVYRQHGRVAFSEEQDIVYRTPGGPVTHIDEPLPHADWAETIVPSPVSLFRYSAVTFNGHRIHYDWPYATETEGYSGLVVHGPLIATHVLDAFKRARPEATIRSFRFRGRRPLIAPTPFQVAGRIERAGQASVWAGNEDGPAQQGEIVFDTP